MDLTPQTLTIEVHGPNAFLLVHSLVSLFYSTFFLSPIEEVPPPPRPPPPSVEMNVPPRPPPPMEVPMDASVVEMLHRPPEDNRMAVCGTRSTD